jgi:hypothetical protein
MLKYNVNICETNSILIYCKEKIFAPDFQQIYDLVIEFDNFKILSIFLFNSL